MKRSDTNKHEDRRTGIEKRSSRLGRAVGRKELLKLGAQRREMRSVWAGFGFFGLVGWSVVVPTLIGAAVGRWLDRSSPGERSWTLVLLIAGLTLGCLNAWRWVSREQTLIREEEREMKHDK